MTVQSDKPTEALPQKVIDLLVEAGTRDEIHLLLTSYASKFAVQGLVLNVLTESRDVVRRALSEHGLSSLHWELLSLIPVDVSSGDVNNWVMYDAALSLLAELLPQGAIARERRFVLMRAWRDAKQAREILAGTDDSVIVILEGLYPTWRGSLPSLAQAALDVKSSSVK